MIYFLSPTPPVSCFLSVLSGVGAACSVYRVCWYLARPYCMIRSVYALLQSSSLEYSQKRPGTVLNCKHFQHSSHRLHLCKNRLKVLNSCWEQLQAYALVLVLYYTEKKKTKFGTCTVVGVNWTLDEAKKFTFTLESTHFIFNSVPLYSRRCKCQI